MIDESLKKDLISHKIYSSWQFIEYTEKNIITVKYCADTINNIVEKMSIRTMRWEQDILSDLVDDVTADGKKVKRVTVTTDNTPTYELRVVGEKIDPWFLFDKLLRDFFQYAMNSFDSISQIINAGLLANRGKKVDSVDIQIMFRTFEQQTYSAAFPKMYAWLEKIKLSDEFQYIEAINNRTKHTADISNKLSMGILGSPNTAQIGAFSRKGEAHEKRELSTQLQATIDFLSNSWNEFIDVFKEEYKRDVYIENRRHTISGVRQQKLKDEPDQNLSYAYIEASHDFDSMPEELYILFVSERENEIYSHECPFDTILITGSSNIDILGRYKADNEVSNDCLLHYRKYIKDNDIKGDICMFYVQKEDTVFYHANPYFNLETVSNDDEFLKRASLPF